LSTSSGLISNGHGGGFRVEIFSSSACKPANLTEFLDEIERRRQRTFPWAEIGEHAEHLTGVS